MRAQESSVTIAMAIIDAIEEETGTHSLSKALMIEWFTVSTCETCGWRHEKHHEGKTLPMSDCSSVQDGLDKLSSSSRIDDTCGACGARGTLREEGLGCQVRLRFASPRAGAPCTPRRHRAIRARDAGPQRVVHRASDRYHHQGAGVRAHTMR